MKKATIKEITIEGEKIIIDFAGAPFWKYYVLQLYFLTCHRKRLIDYIKQEIMKTATIEVLEKGELIFGSPTVGKYFVRRYEDDLEMGGGFFKTKKEALQHAREYKKDK